ncbi:thioesterase family protein [Skermania sp. ID1734]|uniref:thioesterase family protein n=1 Tax=Skermania sp. ID1734 TaxID=2597516 RepID=UPI00351AE4D5
MTAAPFLQLCTVAQRADDGGARFDAYIDPIWTIGPKVHGGVMLALCAAAARRTVREVHPAAEHMQPISVSADYLGAPDPGDVVLAVSVRKLGRQVCLADVELQQNDRTMVRAVVHLGIVDTEPPAWQASDLADMPVEPPAAAMSYEPDSEMGKIVHVAQGCQLRLDTSAAPFLTGAQGDPRLRLWVRPLAGDEADPETAALFAMMAGDISPPVVFNRGHFGWAPTIQLTTHLRRMPAPGWLRVVASSSAVGQRFFDEDHVVLDSTGAVVVQSRQLAMLPQKS